MNNNINDFFYDVEEFSQTPGDDFSNVRHTARKMSPIERVNPDLSFSNNEDLQLHKPLKFNDLIQNSDHAFSTIVIQDIKVHYRF